jgi:hypothetical protein
MQRPPPGWPTPSAAPGSAPPWPMTWPHPPFPPPVPYYPHPAPASGPSPMDTADTRGDIRERLARIETGLAHIQERLTAGHDRMTEHSTRLANAATRMQALERRLLRAEQARRTTRDLLQYAGAALLLVLALMGKIDMTTAVAALKTVFGLPPG